MESKLFKLDEFTALCKNGHFTDADGRAFFCDLSGSMTKEIKPSLILRSTANNPIEIEDNINHIRWYPKNTTN